MKQIEEKAKRRLTVKEQRALMKEDRIPKRFNPTGRVRLGLKSQ